MVAAFATACGSSSKSSGSSASTTTATAPSNVSTTTFKATPIDCNGTPAATTDVGSPSDFKPVVANTLTVVTSLPGPGFWEGSDSDPTKLVSGYEYDIAKQLQQAFGLKNLIVRNVSFDAIVAGTVTKYDVALSQISITCNRAKVVKFSQPYFYSNQGILVKKGFNKPIATVDDAKKLHWGVQTSTTAIDLLDKIQPTTKPNVYQQLADGYTALEAGQVDAFLIDTAINLGEAARSHGALVVPAQFSQPGGPDQYGALLPKDSTNAGAVNAVFKQMRDTGQFQQLAAKDLTVDPGTLPIINVP
jgi:polar amino acid transport system substrate-binding protein